VGSIVVSTSYLQVSIDAMAPVPRHSSDDVLFAEASSWLARLHADDVTAEERRQFLLWYAQSADHAWAWHKVQELFGDMHTPATTVHGRLKQHGEYPWYLRALQVSRPLHFADYGGLPLKILWALLDGVTIIVLSSGLYLWLAPGKGSIEVCMAESERQEAASPAAAL
jgi:Domain of unknown function (DUF4880)/PepSY-associated TM region